MSRGLSASLHSQSRDALDPPVDTTRLFPFVPNCSRLSPTSPLWATPYKNIRRERASQAGRKNRLSSTLATRALADESIRFAVRRAAVVLKAFGLDFIGEL